MKEIAVQIYKNGSCESWVSFKEENSIFYVDGSFLSKGQAIVVSYKDESGKESSMVVTDQNNLIKEEDL